MKEIIRRAPVYDFNTGKIVSINSFFSEYFQTGNGNSDFDSDPVGIMFDMVYGDKTAVINPVTGEWVTPENKPSTDANQRKYDFKKIILDGYSNNQNYPKIYDLCWVDNDLVLYGVLKKDDKNSIYALNFNKNNLDEKPSINKVYDSGLDDGVFYRLHCLDSGKLIFNNKEKELIILDKNGKLKNKFNHVIIYGTSQDGFDIKGGNKNTLAIRDSNTNLNFILKLE